MSTDHFTKPLEVGTHVRIRNSGFGRGTVVEYRGALGPQGARIYRLSVGSKPAVYIEVREDQLEPLPMGT